MADLRPLAFPSLRPAAQPAASPARAESLQAARRAFFEAAMSEAKAAPAPPQPVKTTAAPVAAEAPTPPAGRYPRPGSRLDIKV